MTIKFLKGNVTKNKAILPGSRFKFNMHFLMVYKLVHFNN